MIDHDYLVDHRRSRDSTLGIDFVPQRRCHDETTPSSAGKFEHRLTIAEMTDRLDGWQDFELMPPRYRDQRHARSTLQKWSVVLLCSASITIGSVIAFWVRGRHQIKRHAILIADAKPIGDLRSKTELIELENALLDRWCGWVESALPDDSMVQVLAAAATATHPPDHSPDHVRLEIQSIDIKLHLEHDSPSVEAPTWAQPRFTLTALAKDRDALMPWNERLESSGRLKDIKLTTPSGVWREALIQISAIPLSEKVVP